MDLIFLFDDIEEIKVLQEYLLSKNNALIRGNEIPITSNSRRNMVIEKMIRTKILTVKDEQLSNDHTVFRVTFAKKLLDLSNLINERSILEKYGLIDTHNDDTYEFVITSHSWLPGDQSNLKLTVSEIIKLISQAQKNIWMIIPFYGKKGLEFLQNPLKEAAMRGVQIRIITRQKNELIELLGLELKNLDLEYRDQFISKEWKGNVHSKIILIDRFKAYIGSANLNLSSLTTNFELGVIIKGKKVEILNQIINHLWKNMI